MYQLLAPPGGHQHSKQGLHRCFNLIAVSSQVVLSPGTVLPKSIIIALQAGLKESESDTPLIRVDKVCYLLGSRGS